MAITVTATQGGGTSAGMLLRIKVLTSAAAAQTGATVSSALALNGTITTTVTGSVVYGALSGDAAAGAFSAEPLCTLIDNFHDTTNGEYYGSFRTTSATGTPGATLVGSTTANANRDMAAVEILPNGTLTEDASAPAVATTLTATAVTSASFTPPPGSLLVAMVGSDGAAAGTNTTMALSGGGLTWTEAVHAASGATCYAGVWIAQVPGGGTAATATGAFTLAGAASAAAPATAAGSISVAGTGTAAGQAPAAAAGVLAVSGSAAAAAPVTATGSAVVTGSASATGPGTTAAGVLAVSGSAATAAPVTATGSVTFTGSATAAGPATAAGLLVLAGSATAAGPAAGATGSLALSGAATARAAGAAAGSLVLAGTATAGTAGAATGSLALSGAATARAPTAAAASIAVAGTATATGPSTTATGSLVLSGTVTAHAIEPTGFGSSLPASVLSAYTGPGYQGGPSGAGSIAPSAIGNGWEIEARSAGDYSTLLAVIPGSMLLNWQLARMLNDIGSGTVVLNQDDPWWEEVTLPGGLPTETLLDEECLWQVWKDGVCRFEFFGETVTEQLVDSSEQRQVTITGPGTLTSLKWAMVAPQGFPDIVLKLDGLLDAFDEVDNAGNPVLDTNIWTTASPASDVYITPIAVIYNYPTGAGYALSTLYPSGSLTLSATPGTTYLGASPYDATDTLISAQVTPIGVSSSSTDTTTPATYGTGLDGSELTQFYVQSNFSSQNYAMIGLSATAFYAQLGSGGHVQTQILPAYDSQNHANWMITEQAGTGGGPGTFYFWTSPDGQQWTLQWQVVHSWDATNVTFYVTATYSTAGKQSVQISNLNSNVTTPSYQGAIYLGEPMMGVWLDQFSQAQARGTIPFVTSTVTAAADSFGRAWTDTENVQATNGTDLYSFLQGATAVVDADYVMNPGFQLVVGMPATGQVAVGVDRSNYIVFREGYDIQAKQRVRARDQIATLIGGENSDGHEISAYSPSSIAEWGQREAWFQTSAQVDPTSMAYATASSLAENDTEVVSWTFQLLPNVPGKTVFDNFDVGDWVGLERPDFSAVDIVRVVGIAVQVDSTGAETHELTFLSYIQWLAEQLTYLANKLGGAFVNTLGTTPVAPSKYGTGQVPTYFTPAATLSGLADVASTAGTAQGTAPLVYNPATGQYQHAGTTDPVTGQTIPVTVATPSGSATLGDTSVVVNTGSGSTTVGLQGDGTVAVTAAGGSAPSVPDVPAVAGIVQGLVVSWDGLLSSTTPLSSFSRVAAYVGTTSGFTPSTSNQVGSFSQAGALTVGNLTAGATYYVKLVAFSNSGVASAATTGVPGVPSAVPTSLLTGQLPASLLGNSAGNALNPNPYFNGGDLSGWFVTNGTVSAGTPPSGAPGGAQYAAQVSSTAANCLLSGSPDPFPVTPGQPYVMTAWVYNPGATSTTVAIGFNWASGTTTVSVAPSTWVPLTTVQTCPGGVTSAYQVIGPTVSGKTIWILGAVAAGQVPGQLIAANSVAAQQIAANTITAAQIAANTITAAQIAASTITAGQIAASTITAAQIAASTITATQIAAGTITASKLSAGIVVAGIIDGTTVTGAQFIAYGSTGEILVYSSTPASGNLVLSVSAVSGTDGHSNPYPMGIGLFNSSSKFTTLQASSAGNLTLGTGSSGGGGLEMVSQSTTPNSANSIFYADGNGTAAYRNGSGGWNGQLITSISPVPPAGTAHGTGALTVSGVFTIPANDPSPGTVYRLKAWGVGTYTISGTAVAWEVYVNGTNEAEAATGGLPATFYWESESDISFAVIGASGLCYVKNRVLIGEPGTGSPPNVPGNATPAIIMAMTGGTGGTTISIDTTSPMTMDLRGVGTSATGYTIVGITATIERLGP